MLPTERLACNDGSPYVALFVARAARSIAHLGLRVTSRRECCTSVVRCFEFYFSHRLPRSARFGRSLLSRRADTLLQAHRLPGSAVDELYLWRIVLAHASISTRSSTHPPIQQHKHSRTTRPSGSIAMGTERKVATLLGKDIVPKLKPLLRLAGRTSTSNEKLSPCSSRHLEAV